MFCAKVLFLIIWNSELTKVPVSWVSFFFSLFSWVWQWYTRVTYQKRRSDWIFPSLNHQVASCKWSVWLKFQSIDIHNYFLSFSTSSSSTSHLPVFLMIWLCAYFQVFNSSRIPTHIRHIFSLSHFHTHFSASVHLGGLSASSVFF